MKQKYGEIINLLRIQQNIRAESMADSLYISTEEYLAVERGETELSTLQLSIAGNILGCDIYPLREGRSVSMEDEDLGRLSYRAAKLQALINTLGEISDEMSVVPDKDTALEEALIGTTPLPEETEGFSVEEENAIEAFTEPDPETVRHEDEHFRQYVDEQLREDEKTADLFMETEQEANI